MPSIDFAGVPDQKEFQPAPSGDYVLELVEAVDGLIKNGDNAGQEKTSLKFEIVDCEGDLAEYNGRTIYATATYGEKALPIVKTMLKAFGAEVPETGPLDWEWDDLLGRKLKAKLRSVGEKSDKDDPSKRYPPKNVIVRYLVEDAEEDEK